MLNLDPALQIAWAVANSEACLAGSHEIEPVHFLLGVLKVVDPAFASVAADQLGAQIDGTELTRLAADARDAIGMNADEIRSARRALRSALREPESPGELRALHRSGLSRRLFLDATTQAVRREDHAVRLIDLAELLFADPPLEARGLLAPRRVRPARAPAAGLERSQLRQRGSATPTVDEIGRDLTALARAGRLAPVVGRDREIKMLARILQRTTKANALVIGDAGVGKTAIVEGLAQRLSAPGAPPFLHELRIVEIDVASLVAGAKYRGAMEERLGQLIFELTEHPKVVLFVDEIHLVIGAGAAGHGSMDVANLLKPALARDGVRCIGATTTEEYERHLKDDPAFTRRFQLLRAPEPSIDQAIEICGRWARRIAALQGVVVEEDAVLAAVTLSARLIAGRALPDKAIDLIENAVAFAKIASLTFDGAAPAAARVGREAIEHVIEEQYGISVAAATAVQADRARTALEAEVVGQRTAIEAIVETLLAAEARPVEQSRPLAVLLMTGPTGVGKSHAAERLASTIFGPGCFQRFNMSELKERHELSRLIGAPPGFIGSERHGALFSFAESHPQGLILLDEIDKAHPEIQDYFLQLFDRGEALDTRGRRADFRRHVFVMTCNVTASAAVPIGFAGAERSAPRASAAALDGRLREHFRPEFLARVDRVVAFEALGLSDYEELFDRRMAELGRALGPARVLDISDEARLGLCEQALDQRDGARGFAGMFDRGIGAPVLRLARGGAARRTIQVGWDGEGPEIS